MRGGRALLVSIAIGMMACGSEVDQQRAASGAAGSGGSQSASGSSAMGGTGPGGTDPTGPSGPGGGGGSGGSTDCASYLDDPSPGTTEIVVTNNRAVSIYLPNAYC